MHLVRAIKKYHHNAVADAMYFLGWVWKKPSKRPTNIDHMLQGVPRCDLVVILQKLESKS